MGRGLRLGLGLAAPAASAAAPPFAFANAEAEALVARMNSAPDDARKGAIDDLAGALKAAGVWAKTDVLFVLAAHDAQAALLNWISTSHDAAANGAAAFTVDRGYAGAVAGDHLSSDYDPDSLSGIQFVETVGDGTVQSQHLGVYVLTANGSAAADLSLGSNSFRVIAASDGSGGLQRVSLASSINTITAPAGDAPHHIVGVRTGANSAFAYRNGVAGAETTSIANTTATGPFSICAQSAAATPSEREVAIAHAGGKLTAGEAADCHSAMLAYLQAVGAIA